MFGSGHRPIRYDGILVGLCLSLAPSGEKAESAFGEKTPEVGSMEREAIFGYSRGCQPHHVAAA